MNPDEPCCICGFDADHGIVITDVSGGSFGAICEGCLTGVFQLTRCALCGDRRSEWDRGRSGTVHVDGHEGATADVCPSCRTMMIRGAHDGEPAVAQSARVDKVLAENE